MGRRSTGLNGNNIQTTHQFKKKSHRRSGRIGCGIVVDFASLVWWLLFYSSDLCFQASSWAPDVFNVAGRASQDASYAFPPTNHDTTIAGDMMVIVS